jgi:type II secretory pathway predicted ATPase ExeA
MYEAFFGLREKPFSAAPRADRYFPASSIEAARRTIERCVDRAEGISLLIGAAGTGKSVVGHLLVKRFQPALSVVFLQHGRFKHRKALLQAILFELRLPYRDLDEGELRLALQEYLRTPERCQQGLLLIVDEAHSLTAAQMEELHMLSLATGNGQSRVRLVLLGAAALEEKLTNPRLDAFSQRVVARCYLDSLTTEETAGYVRAQLTVAGGSPALFTADAVKSLHQATDGIPRLVNQVCDHALVLAFAGGRKKIDGPVVEEAWADLQQLPSPWANGRRGVEGDAAIVAPTIIEFGRLDEDEAAVAPMEEFEVLQPALHAWHGDLEQDEPVETLNALEHHLHELEETYQPQSASAPAAAANLHDPFGESFAEEEVVLDRFASLGDIGFRAEQMVTSAMSGEISRLLKPFDRGEPRPQYQLVTSAAAAVEKSSATQVAQFSDPVQPEEPEMIVIEDNPEDVTPSIHPIAKRQDYRQLFAKLRRG